MLCPAIAYVTNIFLFIDNFLDQMSAVNTFFLTKKKDIGKPMFHGAVSNCITYEYKVALGMSEDFRYTPCYIYIYNHTICLLVP